VSLTVWRAPRYVDGYISQDKSNPLKIIYIVYNMLNKGYLACYKHNRLFQSNFTVKQDNANFIKYKDYKV